ncbi:MAG: hypothetical protein ACKVP7_05230 [Hyphomicrobiaceae bacterium]
MIKLITLGLAAVVATLIGCFAGAHQYNASRNAPKPAAEAELEIVKLEPITVPIIRKSKIQGYVIVHAAFGATAAEAKRSRNALTLYAGEALFQAIYEDDAFDFSAIKAAQLAALAEKASKLANAKLGRAAIKQVAIENLSLVPHSGTRDAKAR